MPPGSEVDRPQQATVLRLLQDPATAKEIGRALPKGLDPDNFLRVVQTVVRKSEPLQRCSSASFMGAMLDAAALGVRPGLLGEAHLVPRAGEVVLQLGYPGWQKLARNAGGRISCGVIYEGDLYDYDVGSQPWIHVKPSLTTSHRDANVEAVWAMVDAANGEAWLVVLPPAEIDYHRDHYATKGKDGKFIMPWRHDTEGGNWQAMAKKTVIIKAVKYAPKSTDMEKALALEYAAEPAPDYDIEGESVPLEPPKPALRITRAQRAKLVAEMERTGAETETVQTWHTNASLEVPPTIDQVGRDNFPALMAAFAKLPDAGSVKLPDADNQADTNQVDKQEVPAQEAVPTDTSADTGAVEHHDGFDVVDGEASEIVEPAMATDERKWRADLASTLHNGPIPDSLISRQLHKAYNAASIMELADEDVEAFVVWADAELARVKDAQARIAAEEAAERQKGKKA